jgi:hypothetical protein
MGGINHLNKPKAGVNLVTHKLITSSNYTKFSFFTELRTSLTVGKPTGVVFGVFSTAWLFLYDKFKQWNYSNTQSIVRATFLVTPVYLFFLYDRPFTNFFYRSGFYSLLGCNILLYLLIIYK